MGASGEGDAPGRRGDERDWGGGGVGEREERGGGTGRGGAVERGRRDAVRRVAARRGAARRRAARRGAPVGRWGEGVTLEAPSSLSRATTATGSVALWMIPMSQQTQKDQSGKHAHTRSPVTATHKGAL